eukprot:6465811-Amphidinium_carterae.2
MTTFDALIKLAGKQVLEEHPQCVLFHPEAGVVCEGFPTKPFQKYVHNVYNMMQRLTVTDPVPLDIIKDSMSTGDYSTLPHPFQLPPGVKLQTMHLVVLDHPDVDGYYVIRFMTFNPCINYNQMKQMAGQLRQVNFGNGRKAKRIAVHAFRFLTNLGGAQLSTHLVKDATTSHATAEAMDIVGEHSRPIDKQKQPLLSKDQIKNGFDLIRDEGAKLTMITALGDGSWNKK